MGKNTTKAAAPAPAPAPAPAADQAQDTGTVEAVEQANPEGVATIEGVESERPDNAEPGEQIDGQGLEPAADQAQGDATTYAVAWSIKFEGKRYNEGDTTPPMTAEQAAPFLASGAIVKA